MVKREGNITIREVARAAGVSIGTASRVLNGKQSVRPEIRARVQQAIEELGYRPNAVAQSMRRRSTHMVGCIIREINIPSLAAFVRAAHDVLDKAGFSFLISNSEGRIDRERELLDRLSRQQTDGIMLGPYTPIDDTFDTFLRSLDTPIVLVDRDEPKWADCVMADHAGATFEATSRLLDLGHRRIVLLTGEPVLYPARARLKGYLDAFAARGLKPEERLVRAQSFFATESLRQTSSLLAGDDPPTAIIAGGIDMLAGVLKAIRVRGLKVPDDISVVAAGDSELAELYAPAISVERWDQAEIGRTAAELLINRMVRRTSDPPQHVLLPAEFIQRGSIAPPRANRTRSRTGEA
ncbi:LacI family transcriptional regulator [Tepidamorphus gemmatus]|jgi:LacI family transcriptional regulator|uniref:LacI family transcriptional regulator n=1 Tax=Tepidamorphus gemmatus TaxID=747076 RepID=A0A4R3M643_9HYPH|nr:LacI family DNA-binding transcriptional regulator [Tepidamorphus gemmatus]TCT08426.1 LacI family transcriptional regulator [Tepidamorphus gemmatus]